jgi:hypothetical protein
VLFADFKNHHRGEFIIVCGLGVSIRSLRLPCRFTTIGCNDIGRLFHPTYLLNVNSRNQYGKGDRYQYIENTKAKALFTHQPGENLGVKAQIVRFEIAERGGGVEIVDDRLPHFRNTPYMGVALAGYFGASTIGILGVDLTGGHFWIQDGPHRLEKELDIIDKQYGKLAAHLKTQGTEVVNLSPISKLTSLPRMSLDELC